MRHYDKKDIMTLLRLVEVAAQRKMKSSSDFEFLSNAIALRCRHSLSISTLKRLWGYANNKHLPYFSTLCVLTQFIGYKDFDDFLANKDLEVPSSFTYEAESILSQNLCPGDMLWITWSPNRRCLITYHGSHRFHVTEAHNTKLCEGDSFHAMRFSEGMPLFLDKYIHKDNPPVTFVVGYSGGLSSVKLVKPSQEEEEEEVNV